MFDAQSPITGLILARNEERHIEDALRSLLGWTRQPILVDDGSTDHTVEIARRCGALVIDSRTGRPLEDGPAAPQRPPSTPTHPHTHTGNFDALRELALPYVASDWIWVLDADERVPPRLGPLLLQWVGEHGEAYSAAAVPFKNYFCGRGMEYSGWWPAYCRENLLKKGCFRYGRRLHSGVQVEGKTFYFPPDPELAIIHYSYDNLHHYLEKQNRYTSGEAQNLLADGKSHSWQAMLAHFVHDLQAYYERGRGDLDGMHGFVLAWLSGNYRFNARAKLWDLRRQQGEWNPDEPVPANLAEMFDFMARVAREGAGPWIEGPGFSAHGSGDRSAPQPSTVNSQPEARSTLALVYRAPLLGPSGFEDEARGFVFGLAAAGEPIAVAPEPWGDADAGLSAEARTLLERLTVPADTPCELALHHTLIPLLRPSPHARFNIGRVMFETDRLPEGWAAHLNQMGRLLVPSEFNRETFVRSGVDPDKLGVLPGALDTGAFTAEVEPWPLPFGLNPGAHPHTHRPTHPYVFLAVFDWTLHKGWDVLVEAFAREFDPSAPAGPLHPHLLLKVWSSNHYTLADIRAQVDAHLRARLGRGLDAFPNIHLWQERIPLGDLPRLYRAVDAFVLPTRGEGWCRPLMEAMCSGLPTLATAWSGLTAFHDAEVGYPLRYRLEPVSPEGAREIPVYAGHCWAEPDLEDLRRLLRHVMEHPEEARAKGAAARERVVARYSRPVVARLLQEELARCRDLAARPAPGTGEARDTQHAARSLPAPEAPAPTPNAQRPPAVPRPNPLPRRPAEPVDYRAVLGRPLRVRVEGDQTLRSSLALVNRELCLRLLLAGDVELSLWEPRTPWHTLSERDDPRLGPLFARLGASLSGPPDVILRHHFPPNWERPAHGRLVVMQPWEYGHLPGEWVTGARQADEVWAYSRFVRDIYVRSGVRAEMVRVVPLGFNPDVFTPEGPVFQGPGVGGQGSGQTVFLFVGGALDRKGADLLLEAYLRAFTVADPVLLLVKDMGTHTFYKNATFAQSFRQAQADPRLARVLYLDDDLSDRMLAALYRACTCLVLPYRGEGFGLPPLEAMACGRMPLVTAGGPTDDYVTDETAYRLPCRRRYAGDRRVGFEGCFECVGDPWQLEPDAGALVGALRWVHAHPEEVRRRGAAARDAVAGSWTWDAAAAELRERLLQLVAPPSAAAVVPARPWAPPAAEPSAPPAPEEPAMPKVPFRFGHPKIGTPRSQGR